MQLYPIHHNHYPQQINKIHRPNGNFSAIIYACEHRRLYLQRLHIPQSYHKPLKEPQIESHNTNRMHALPFTRQH